MSQACQLVRTARPGYKTRPPGLALADPPPALPQGSLLAWPGLHLLPPFREAADLSRVAPPPVLPQGSSASAGCPSFRPPARQLTCPGLPLLPPSRGFPYPSTFMEVAKLDWSPPLKR
ncbi:U1 small nuclear ribonucleoprotein C-like [Portunus trituberculatus]|uniref:U1 small nuclear ribonucleoprotein C-like n=1 Tax=Portunus trituberculatus TaxID=210409 RepID=UPI001E1CDB52|nr:U1 small nuclear ribonucleoprotein C-like [Portunus trituberculatus]